MVNKLELGIDISTYFDEKDDGSRYYKDNKEIDPLSYFIDNNGVKYVRLRLWNDPYDVNNKPYGAGTCNYERTLKLAKICLKYGYKLVLDIHYSDFWADPGKQFLPKKWKDLSFDKLIEASTDFTIKILTDFKNEGIYFDAIQIGNEITNGFMWPHGKLLEKEDKTQKRDNYDNFCTLIAKNIEAKNKIMPNSLTIIHLERSNDKHVYNEFFDEITSHNIPFDIIGASYYPYWHGTFDEFFDNMTSLMKKYNKKVWVMEFAYAFTKDDYLKTNQNQLITRDNSLFFPYPLTIDGQQKCVSSFIDRAKKEHIGAIFYWEPCWIPNTHTYWATIEGQKYIHEEGKSARNEWSNQCLFDYDGNALPSLDKFKSN